MNFATEAPPSKFLCPLTHRIMSDPVLSIHGTTFERKAILKWLETNTVCPVTGKPLALNELLSNKNLRSLITGWKEVSDYDEEIDDNNSFETDKTNSNTDEETLMKLGLIGCSQLAFQKESQALLNGLQMKRDETRVQPTLRIPKAA